MSLIRVLLVLTVLTAVIYFALWCIEILSWHNGDILFLMPGSAVLIADNIFSITSIGLSLSLLWHMAGWRKLLMVAPIIFWLGFEVSLFYIVGRFGVSEQDRVTVDDGREFLLTKGRSGGVMIYERLDPIQWRNSVAELETSLIDGVFEPYKLALSADESMLAVHRGALVSDCITIETRPARLCAALPPVPEPDDRAGWASRSTQILKILGGEEVGLN